MKPPGDIVIDLTIRKLGFGSPCLDKVIVAKTKRYLDTQKPQPKRV